MLFLRPNQLGGLLPDNGLANVATQLIKAGHETLIWDCATVDMVAEFPAYRDKQALDAITPPVAGFLPVSKENLEIYREKEAAYISHEERAIGQIANELAAYVADHQLDFVGFKLFSGHPFWGTELIARAIRTRNPTVKLVAGGPHIDYFMERVFAVTDAFDVLIHGEGEVAIVPFAEYVEGKRPLSTVPNAIYRRGDGEIERTPTVRVQDLDAIPLPSYDESIYPAMRRDQKIKIFTLDDSRGCNNECSFCIHPAKSGRVRRASSPARLVDRIEHLRSRYGTSSFKFAGSNPPHTMIRSTAEEIIARRLSKLAISSFAHIRDSQIEDYAMLRQAGWEVLWFGIESGSQQILDQAMNKKTRVDWASKCVAASKAAAIKTMASFIVPAPFDDAATKKETATLIAELQLDSALVFPPMLVPRSNWVLDKAAYEIEFSEAELLAWQYEFTGDPFNHWTLSRPPPSWKINGKTFALIALEFLGFLGMLRAKGAQLDFEDFDFLFARYAEEPVDLFLKKGHDMFVNRDVDSLQRTVIRINDRLEADSR